MSEAEPQTANLPSSHPDAEPPEGWQGALPADGLAEPLAEPTADDALPPKEVTDLAPAEPEAAAAQRSVSIRAAGQVRPLVLVDMAAMWKFGKCIVEADMLPDSYKEKGKLDGDALVSKVVVALQLGAEVGLMPMQSIQSIYVVNGIPTIYGDAQLALVRQSGLLESIVETIEGEGDKAVAVCTVKRKGEATTVTRKFSMAQASKAQLKNKKGPWTYYPERMMTYRARAYTLRDVFPDVLKGLTRTYEEAMDMPVHTEAPVVGDLKSLLANETKPEELPALETTDKPITADEIIDGSAGNDE